MRKKRQCIHCKKWVPIKRPSRDLKAKYCSVACASKHLIKLPLVPCPVCGDQMSPAAGRIYCSYKCAGLASRRNYEMKCGWCEKIFFLHNMAEIERGGGKYCSRRCLHKGQRKYKVNEHYFDRIDTAEKAYWMGFLFADGYQNGREMVCNLQIRDKNHLKQMRKAFSSNHPISNRTDGMTVSLRIGSKELCAALNRMGCIQAKSLIVKFPKLEKRLQRHFIRGVFDGDGCASMSKRGRKYYLKCSIFSGSHEFIDEICKILSKNNIECRTHLQSKGKVVTISKKESLSIFYKFLYKNARTFLKRKKQKFLNYWEL
jgi:DNA-binding transcriptional regulator WhiA